MFWSKQDFDHQDRHHRCGATLESNDDQIIIKIGQQADQEARGDVFIVDVCVTTSHTVYCTTDINIIAAS